MTKHPDLYILCLILLLSINAHAQEHRDSTKTVQLPDVVITASRLKEETVRSPVTIEKFSEADIRQSASPSFFDAIENVKGVQMLTPSLGFKVINTRGFTNTTNVRFVQMVDGIDNQSPHIGAPIANSLGPSDLDIESVEIIPGVASALYGMNAINGLANFITKDPFKNMGFEFQQKTGFNRAGTGDGAKPFSESSIRWAHAFRSKIAIKINGTFLRGTDWVANDQTDLNSRANISTGLTGANNPAIDPVNSYGNESSNRRTLSLNGKNYVVARTGYYEREVLDYDIRNMKGDASVHYSFYPDAVLAYTYRFANLDNVYQRANRFRLENYQLQQHALTFQDKSIQIRTYLNMENTGDSYNARSMSENIDKSFKSDQTWFSEYTAYYENAISSRASVEDAHHIARSQSDAGRPVPGTKDFKNLINELGNVNNWDYGAALRVKSRMFHSEGQIDLTEQLLHSVREATGLAILLGFDHRTYIIIPDGNYFINPNEAGKNLLYSKSGAFLQFSRNLFNQRLKLGVAIRADKNEYFPLKWNPRFTAVYSPTRSHNIRISYQNGYRFPSVFEAFSNVNSGGVKRVGGLPLMSDGIFETAYKRASIDAFQSAINSDVNTQQLTKEQAIEKNKNLLVNSDYSYIQPEHINSLEIGYRALFFQQALELDIDFYYNRYTNFIAQVEMNVPKSSNPDSVAFYLADKQKQNRYRMWTNSKTTTYNYGSSAGLKYHLQKNFQITGNISFSRLQRRSGNDGLEDGYNTPRLITNLSIGNEKLFRSFGFQVTYRWQSSYYWQSFLVNGNVPAYQTYDAQVGYQLNKFRLKIGATNLLNHYYNSYLGGPAVGGMYYTTVTVSL